MLSPLTSEAHAAQVLVHGLSQGARQPGGRQDGIACISMSRQVEGNAAEAATQVPGQGAERTAMEPVGVQHEQRGASAAQVVVAAAHGVAPMLSAAGTGGTDAAGWGAGEVIDRAVKQADVLRLCSRQGWLGSGNGEWINGAAWFRKRIYGVVNSETRNL